MAINRDTKTFKERQERISKIYDDAGVGEYKPEGRGLHTIPFHRCAAGVMKSQKENGKKVNTSEAYATCMMQLGRNKSVVKKHRK